MNAEEFNAMIIRETDNGTFSRSIEKKRLHDLPEGDVLINVRYSSLNYKDVLSAQGNKGVTRRYPHTPGIDASGIVIESKSNTVNPGDTVLVTGYDLGMNTPGGFSEYIRVPSDWIVHLPGNLNLKESMCYGTAGFTAGLSVNRLMENNVTPDKGPVLVTGATGGVGSIAVSIMSKLGFSVTAVNGHTDRTDYLKSIGASEIISMENATDLSARPLLKQRWSGAIDAVGGEMLSTAIRAVMRHGTVTTCGNVSSGELNTSIYPFILRGVILAGIDSATTPMNLRLKIWDKLADEWKPDTLESIVTELDGLDALSEQIDLLLAHKRTGRAIVKL